MPQPQRTPLWAVKSHPDTAGLPSASQKQPSAAPGNGNWWGLGARRVPYKAGSCCEVKGMRQLTQANVAQIHICSAAPQKSSPFSFSHKSIYSGRSGSSPDKHIDFKIKCVPTAAAPRLKQTETWHWMIIKYIFIICHFLLQVLV